MFDRKVPTGFEKFVVESWRGWDQFDTVHFIFTECILNSSFCERVGFDPDPSKSYDVEIDLNNLRVTISEYKPDVEDQEIHSYKISDWSFQNASAQNFE